MHANAKKEGKLYTHILTRIFVQERGRELSAEGVISFNESQRTFWTYMKS